MPLGRTAGVLLFFTFCTAAIGQGGPRYFEEQEMAADSSQQIADRIVTSKIPVCVDFWAVWCVPCRMLNPTLEKLEKQYHGKVLFLKVNVDYNRQIAAYFGIQGIPAVFVIRDKAVKRALVGVRPEADYRAAIDEVLAMRAPAGTKQKQDTAASTNSPAHKPPVKKGKKG
jgi:thioredoxin 1